MKKVAVMAVFFGVLIFAGVIAYGAEAQPPPADKPKEEVIVPKEFISKNVPKEVQDLLDTLVFAFPGETKMYYSGRVPGVNDYGLRAFDTGHGVVQVLFSLALEKDEKGNINPGGAVAEVVAYVFVDKKVSWYQSADAKAIFEKATK